jgi:hypothetical protein
LTPALTWEKVLVADERTGKGSMMRLRRFAAALACVVGLATTQVGLATADPTGGSDTRSYSFTNCTDGSSFQAIKQRSQGAALFLVDGSGIFVAMKAVSDRDQTAPDGTFYEEGTIFFETPGFSGPNGLPTITCTNFSPLSQTWARVTGYIAPTK